MYKEVGEFLHTLLLEFISGIISIPIGTEMGLLVNYVEDISSKLKKLVNTLEELEDIQLWGEPDTMWESPEMEKIAPLGFSKEEMETVVTLDENFEKFYNAVLEADSYREFDFLPHHSAEEFVWCLEHADDRLHEFRKAWRSLNPSLQEKIVKALDFNTTQSFEQRLQNIEELIMSIIGAVSDSSERPDNDVLIEELPHFIESLERRGIYSPQTRENYSLTDLQIYTKWELIDSFNGSVVIGFHEVHQGDRAVWYVAGVITTFLSSRGKTGIFFHFLEHSKLRDVLSDEDIEKFWSMLTGGKLEVLVREIIEGSKTETFSANWVEQKIREYLHSVSLEFLKQKGFSERQVEKIQHHWSGVRDLASALHQFLTKKTRSSNLQSNIQLVLYISTEPEDFFYLGTSLDANPQSCFWSPSQSHAIPSLLVATNVAVAYIFEVKNPRVLDTLGLSKNNPLVVLKESIFPTLSQDDELGLIGRCIVEVNPNGGLDVSDRNYYKRGIGYRLDLNWIVRYFLQKYFGFKRFSATEWALKPPPP